MNFKEWFQNEHISSRDRISMKQAYTDDELRKNINPGDLIHFGFDTKVNGKSFFLKFPRFLSINHSSSFKASS